MDKLQFITIDGVKYFGTIISGKDGHKLEAVRFKDGESQKHAIARFVRLNNSGEVPIHTITGDVSIMSTDICPDQKMYFDVCLSVLARAKAVAIPMLEANTYKKLLADLSSN